MELRKNDQHLCIFLDSLLNLKVSYKQVCDLMPQQKKVLRDLKQEAIDKKLINLNISRFFVKISK
jgi:hypothetical protein